VGVGVGVVTRETLKVVAAIVPRFRFELFAVICFFFFWRWCAEGDSSLGRCKLWEFHVLRKFVAERLRSNVPLPDGRLDSLFCSVFIRELWWYEQSIAWTVAGSAYIRRDPWEITWLLLLPGGCTSFNVQLNVSYSWKRVLNIFIGGFVVIEACINIVTWGRVFSRLLSLLRQDLLRAFLWTC